MKVKRKIKEGGVAMLQSCDEDLWCFKIWYMSLHVHYMPLWAHGQVAYGLKNDLLSTFILLSALICNMIGIAQLPMLPPNYCAAICASLLALCDHILVHTYESLCEQGKFKLMASLDLGFNRVRYTCINNVNMFVTLSLLLLRVKY